MTSFLILILFVVATASSHCKANMDGPYERILLGLIKNFKGTHFITRKELLDSWELFTPLLKKLEGKKPFQYEYGSTGPKEADILCQKYGVSSETYLW